MESYFRAALVLLSASGVISNEEQTYTSTSLRGAFDDMANEAKHHSDFEALMGACNAGCAHLHAGGDADCLSCCVDAGCARLRIATDACICRNCEDLNIAACDAGESLDE
eukprot:339459_1